jgi:metal-sulfur cluster biosynthetic enzyme
MSRTGVVSERDVLEALRVVIDPELDASIVELGFVAEVVVDSAEVRVALRLPTFWCAPNFSWLMAEDARQAVLGLPGVERVVIELLDHHAGEEISLGVSQRRSFEETFAGEATENLESLRRLFRRKAFFKRQEQLLGSLPRTQVRRGLTLAELPDSPEARAYRAIRAELGLDCSPRAPAITDAQGREVEDVEAHLQRIRLMRVSMDANTVLCRGLLETRYALAGAAQ